MCICFFFEAKEKSEQTHSFFFLYKTFNPERPMSRDSFCLLTFEQVV